jgi:hypothetical protein
MLEGKALVVGVAGNTFTEFRGDRGLLTDGVMEVDEVEDVLECVCWWW